jgi:hypothetical protein
MFGWKLVLATAPDNTGEPAVVEENPAEDAGLESSPDSAA